ncbi:hypothetical protein ANN_11589 [Periplaneta americana]|uniref:Uncharacterized protein n=1 Tax=Periplaneta americana TaxID=6978 RepID=A0ABQ8T5F5_PERAM|nr:hypothetical protein ANN_11589 [Periplaneta americana]
MASVYGFQCLKSKKRRCKKRWRIHPLNQRRIQQGEFYNLLEEMRVDDPQQFVKYIRMNPIQFDTLLNLVAPFLRKKSNRASLPEALRLSITLRPPSFVDRENDGQVQQGEWKRNVPVHGALNHLRNGHLRIGTRNASAEAIRLREEITNYFITPAGAIQGQTQYVLRGLVYN